MTTYAILKADVAGWLLRDDLTAAIPSFIRLCESALRRDLRIRQMLKTVTWPITAQSTTLPDDFLEMNRIALSSTSPELQYMPPSVLYASYAYGDGGEPAFYTIEGTNLITAPDATGNDVLLGYYRAFDALSNDSDTNWLLTSGYDAYLYGSLLHSAPYIKEDERVALWDQAYNSAIRKLTKSDARSTFAGSALGVRNGAGP